MAEVCLTVGIPASGKSTWARQQIAAGGYDAIVCRDDIRLMQGLKHGEDENLVTMVERALIEGLILEDKRIIVADTNINMKFRNQLINFCHEHGADVTIKVFDVGLDQAIMWDAARGAATVGAPVIARMYSDLQGQDVKDELLPVQTWEQYEHDWAHPTKKDAVAFDIDGTLARHVNRSPYDESKVGDDEAIEDVVSMVTALCQFYFPIFVSGRKDTSRKDTADWIERHTGISLLPFEDEAELHMRKAGDTRPDWVIKNEIYDELIPRFNIIMVFDDRDQVVRHLRRRGITVAQVAPGRF